MYTIEKLLGKMYIKGGRMNKSRNIALREGGIGQISLFLEKDSTD